MRFHKPKPYGHDGLMLCILKCHDLITINGYVNVECIINGKNVQVFMELYQSNVVFSYACSTINQIKFLYTVHVMRRNYKATFLFKR